MAVSLTVYVIFSVKISCDLEKWVRGCSRSLKMAPFNRPTTFYWSAIVNIALSCTVFELLSRRSRQRERLSASMLSICLFVSLFVSLSVCLSVCHQNAKNAIFSKTKQFRATAMVSVDDL